MSAKITLGRVSAMVLPGLLSLALLFSCKGKDEPTPNPVVPVLPEKILTKIGADIDEVRAFEAERKNAVVKLLLPTEPKENGIWIYLAELQNPDGTLADFCDVSYSGKGRKMLMATLYMRTKEVYAQYKVKDYLEYHYDLLGKTTYGAMVYGKADSDIIVVVTLEDAQEGDLNGNYQLLWCQKSEKTIVPIDDSKQ